MKLRSDKTPWRILVQAKGKEKIDFERGKKKKHVVTDYSGEQW